MDAKNCPLHQGSTPAAADEAAYQALNLCDIDGDERTTGTILECLHITSPPPRLAVPEPVKLEHDELHEELVAATEAGGRVAEAALAVADLLHPHFVKEEEYALPPLGLLRAVASGEVDEETARAAVAMTERLRAELPEMLEEHRTVVRALEGLAAAATDEGKPRFARFADKLILHARTEEEVLYPAALLVGERLGDASS